MGETTEHQIDEKISDGTDAVTTADEPVPYATLAAITTHLVAIEAHLDRIEDKLDRLMPIAEMMDGLKDSPYASMLGIE